MRLLSVAVGGAVLLACGCVQQAVQAVAAPQSVAAGAVQGATQAAVGKAEAAGTPIGELLDAGATAADLRRTLDGATMNDPMALERLRQEAERAQSAATAETRKRKKGPRSAWVDPDRDAEWDRRIQFERIREPAAVRRMRLPAIDEVDYLGEAPKRRGDQLLLGSSEEASPHQGLVLIQQGPPAGGLAPILDLTPVRVDR
jgi:hypothetical protein